MLYLKRALYYAVVERSQTEQTTFHQIVVRALIDYLKFRCEHAFHRDLKKERKDPNNEKIFTCCKCGYIKPNE